MLKPGTIRFILAIIVVLFHITKIVFLGHFAVLCFFMLSGYWITVMYENKYLKFEKPLKVFYVSRIWRLFPVFLLFNFLAFLFSYYYNPHIFQAISLMQWPVNALYWGTNLVILGFYNMGHQALVPAWSLDIELQFYLLYPLLLYVFRKSNFLMIIAFIIITAFFSVYHPAGIISKTLIYYLCYFLVGIMIYLKKLSFNKRIEIWCTSVFIFVVVIQYFIPGLKKITVVDNATNYCRYLNEFLPLLLIPLISNSVRNKSSKLDRILGDMSFVLYLCHWVLIIPYDYYIIGLSKSHRIPYSVAYLSITLTISYLVYKLYDKPIDNLRRQWVESHKLKDLSPEKI